MENLKIYEIENSYIDHLFPFAPHLFHNKKENQGDLYRIKNDSDIIKEYPACSFKTINVMKARCISNINIDLIKGSIYDVVSIDKERNECRVIDESGEDYIYKTNIFEFL